MNESGESAPANSGSSPLGSRSSSFLGAPRVPCDIEALKAHGARAVVVGVPFDQATVYMSGTSLAPKYLREASDQFLAYLGDWDVDVFDKFRLVDCGDVPVIPGNAERSRQRITEYVGRIIDAGAVPICIGGDHSIPIPIGDALERRVHGKFGYLSFDAHLDTASAVDGEINTNWSGTSRTAERNKVDPRNVVVVGVHGATNPLDQFSVAQSLGIGVYTMRDVMRDGIEVVVEAALCQVMEGTDTFYVSWDTDVVDAGFMPGTAGPEPGGLTSREVLVAAAMVGRRAPGVMDIAELLPSNDYPAFVSCRLACCIILEVLGAMGSVVRT